MSDRGSRDGGVEAAVVREAMASALERVEAVAAEVLVVEPGRDGAAVTSRHRVQHVRPGLWRVDVDGRRRLVVTGRRQVVEDDGGVLSSHPGEDEAWAAAGLPRGGVLGWGTAFLGGDGADVEALDVAEDHDPDLDRPIWRVRAAGVGTKDHVYDVSVDRETGLPLGFRALGMPYEVRTLSLDLSSATIPDDLFVLDEREIVAAPVQRSDGMGRPRPVTYVRFEASAPSSEGPGTERLVFDTTTRQQPGGIGDAVLAALGGDALGDDAVADVGEGHNAADGVEAIWPASARFAAAHPGTRVTLVWAGFQREIAARPQECIEVLLALTDAARGMRRSLDVDLILTP